MKWLRNKDGKRKNIRTGKALETYRVPQGACSDGRWIYVAYEQKKPQKVKIARYDAKTYKLIRVSKALNVGHANDMAYRKGKLYITHSGTTSKIHVVDADTLEHVKDIKVAGGYYFNGIAREGDGFLLRCMGGRTMLVVDKHFKKIRTYKAATSIGVSQSMDTTDKYVIRAWASANPTQSKQNYISYNNHKGKLIKKKRLPLTGELESAFMVGDTLHGLVYRKKKVDGKMKYYAFIFTL